MKKPAPIKLSGVSARPVRTREDGRWYWRAERERVTLGCAWATRSEAETWVAHLVVGVQGRPEEPQLGTVVLLLGAWLAVQESRTDISPSTAATYHTAAKRLADAELGLRTVRVDRMTRAAVDAWVRSAQRVGYSASAVRLSLAVLSMAWQWGRREGETPDRDLDVPHVRAQATRDKRTPTAPEIAAVLAALDDWVRVAAVLQVETGARLGEIAALRWSDVDLARGRIALGRHQGATKTGARTLPLSGAAVDALASLPAGIGDAPLFGRSPLTVAQGLQRRLRELGVDWTPHALRRAMVDRLARAGVEMATAARWTGHSPEVMMRAYRTVTDSDLEHAAEQLGQPRGGLRSVK